MKAADNDQKQRIADIFRGAVRDEELAERLTAAFNKRYNQASVEKALELRNRQKGRTTREGQLSSAADIAAASMISDNGKTGMQAELYEEIDELSQAAGMSIPEATELVIRAHGGDPGRVLSKANINTLGSMDADWRRSKSGSGESNSSEVGQQWSAWDIITEIQTQVARGGGGIDKSHPVARFQRSRAIDEYYRELQTDYVSGSGEPGPDLNLDPGGEPRRVRHARDSIDARFGSGAYSQYMQDRKEMKAALDRLPSGEGFSMRGFRSGFRATERAFATLGHLTTDSLPALISGDSLDNVTANYRSFRSGLNREERENTRETRQVVNRVMVGQDLEVQALMGQEIETRYSLGRLSYELGESVVTEVATLGAMKAFTAARMSLKSMRAARASRAFSVLNSGKRLLTGLRYGRISRTAASVAQKMPTAIGTGIRKLGTSIAGNYRRLKASQMLVNGLIDGTKSVAIEQTVRTDLPLLIDIGQ